ncbi:MAG: 1-acyl-sn-glycerol-3-phosphate acyltransferase [Xanthomonadales bacterium PRO7]|nr:1-acyl-sn-glycerol-3-phosphate acyltransferase [Xanthomonadales bacterium PRO7]
MHSTADPSTETRRDWRRPLRYLWRTPWIFVHVVVAVPLTLVAFSPVGRNLHLRGERLDCWLQRWWSAGIVRRCGFRIVRVGEPLPGPVLFVANHVSWLDIELMHSQRVMSFVAKAEIARWPLIGWLASRAGTIFHRRGSGHSLNAVMEQAVERLRDGMAVGVFPEGGTGPGDRLRTFHARIFQIAADAQVTVQPVAISYGNNGKMDLRVPFADGESFFANVVRLLGDPGVEAHVRFLDPVELNAEGRRQTAEAVRTAIALALDYTDDA